MYKQCPFDYQTALETLEREAESQPKDKPFMLVDLPSFSEISIVKAENSNLKPSIVRARLGKMFNCRVRDGKVKNVIRSRDKNGKLEFICRTAVYMVTDKDNTN